MSNANTYPKLHNAAWPGLVGKEEGTENPPIPFEQMLEWTAAAEVDGHRFDARVGRGLRSRGGLDPVRPDQQIGWFHQSHSRRRREEDPAGCAG